MKWIIELKADRQAYLVQIEGKSNINGITLNERDAMEIVEENIKIKAELLSHFIIVEMKKSEYVIIFRIKFNRKDKIILKEEII